MADYRKIVPFILAEERGENRDPKDPAAKRPAPGGGGLHTNKGVTWGTFVDLAPKVGYKPTLALFRAMPATVWGQIFKRGFWDEIGGDQIQSQALADALVEFAYMASPGRALSYARLVLRNLGHGYLKPKGTADRVLLAAINGTNAQRLVAAYMAARLAFIKRGNPRYQKNWLLRYNKLKSYIARLGAAEPTQQVAGVNTLQQWQM
ncbi:hypothetical protein HER32_00275 [Hymenobacter sp. BT18]|uniref:glycosyl hydrolase 108 family protein n=1 Tax=Hymenobacter sp. BT18 TaxID=2835648 RepID=UPI00143EC744|nr:glycosyl hydrolase 108 family protein [Hymenobacter sp. BT18]QIX59711.1 hypothetical protein HER32_00275 [Hymenobacter sp. BT18]